MLSRNDIESYLQSLNPELFSFAYAIVPDDLQAQQIVIDAIFNAFGVEKEVMVRLCTGPLPDKEPEFVFDEIKIIVMRHIYRIARKRSDQLKAILFVNSDKSPFFSLSHQERATIYLKHKLKWSIDVIGGVLERSNTEVLIALNNGRNGLVKQPQTGTLA